MRPSFTIALIAAVIVMWTVAAGDAAAQSGWWNPVQVDRQEMRNGDARSGPAVIYRETDQRRRTESGRNDRRNERYDPYERYDRAPQQRGNQGKRANAPAFCRSGQGHPVHGRAWCVEKGFGLGGDYRYDQRRYDDRRQDRRSRIEDIIFGGRSTRGTLDRRAMEGVLGRSTVNMLSGLGADAGFRGDLNGRWVDAGRNGRVMQVRAGQMPLAELVDRDGDRRVDYVVLFR